MAEKPSDFEIYWNEQRADLAVYRIILTMFLFRVVGQHLPTALEQVQGLKRSVLDAVGRIKPDPGEQGQERMKQMTAMRAEKFFVELEILVSEALPRMGEQE
jgi:hypothetical protein